MTIDGNGEGNLTNSFAGLRVLDFSTTIAGPHCTRMLADMGAEVIKIETEEGETMRTRPPLRNSCSTTFGQLNVGKKSLVLDLKSPKGIEAVRRLVATADVLVENFRPGVMRRLKLDYASLHELNPKLIYLLDLRIWPDRAVGGTAGLCAGDSCRLGLRDGPSGLPARTQPAGLLRHLSCRRPHRRLCLRRHLGGAVPAHGHREGPAHRRVDAGIDAQPDLERIAMVAIRGEGDAAADVRSDRNLGRLCDGRHRQRKNLPEPDEGDRSSGVGDRSALCQIFRSPRKLGQPDGWRRGMVARGDD